MKINICEMCIASEKLAIATKTIGMRGPTGRALTMSVCREHEGLNKQGQTFEEWTKLALETSVAAIDGHNRILTASKK